MKYHKIVEPESTKAEGILAAIDQSFFEFDLANYKQKTVGFCSDGTSVMTGAKKGVIQLMKTNGNADWIKEVWCLTNRLELAVKDAFKSTYMNRVIEMLISTYYFYKGSAERFMEAEDIAELIGEHFLKPQKANGTRWVDHKLRETAKLIENWAIIVTQMENYAEDKSNKAENRTKVRVFVKDVLNEVAKISLLFQREDITVYSAVTKLQSAQTSLRGLIDNDGPSVTEIKVQMREEKFHDFQLLNLLPDDTLANDRRRITQAALDSMSSRLENLTTGDIFLASNAFDHKNWQLATERYALLQYGTGDVRVVFRHYQTILTNAGCNLVNALSQWTDLKFHVASNARYNNQHPLLVWQLVSQMDQDKGDYRDILKSIHLTSVLPLANASCERAFSTMKRIKSDWRCRLGSEVLDILMRIKIADVRFRAFDPKPAVTRWWLSGQRQKRGPILCPIVPEINSMIQILDVFGLMTCM